jgi:hypothetical protein
MFEYCKGSARWALPFSMLGRMALGDFKAPQMGIFAFEVTV